MLSEANPMVMNITAPNRAKGTDMRITIGSRKLSNCAASARNTMMIAKPKVTKKPQDSDLKHHRPQQGQGHRHENHDRIAETFKLRRERQKHDDDREAQGYEEASGFRSETSPPPTGPRAPT